MAITPRPWEMDAAARCRLPNPRGVPIRGGTAGSTRVVLCSEPAGAMIVEANNTRIASAWTCGWYGLRASGVDGETPL
jgi:hypothetical protein